MEKVHGIAKTSPVFVKQYGFYRTSTNYVEAVLPRNFYCTVLRNVLGCKHELPKRWDREVEKAGDKLPRGVAAAVKKNAIVVVVTIKDPYAWLDSFLRYWIWKKSVVPNIRKVTRAFVREKVQLYSQLCQAWADLSHTCRVSIIRCEDLLSDHTATFIRVGRELKLVRKSRDIVRLARRIDPHKALRALPFDPDYYLERRYLGALTSPQKAIVRHRTDWAFFTRYGYSRRG